MTREELIAVVTAALTSGKLSTYVNYEVDVIDGSLDEVVETVVDAVLAAQADA